jgi:hypothetical protein
VRNARPWLYRIAHNVSVNSLRTPVADPHEVIETRGGHEVDQVVEHRLQARAALARVAALPRLQRQVFMRTTLDRASHEEVASALGLSSGAVRGLMYRARAAVRAGAAAVIPAPVVGWVLRRADSQTGGSPAIAELLAGGTGAGFAAAIAKGGAVLTLAVAGASGVVLSHGGAPHPGQTGAVRSSTTSRHASRAFGPTRAATPSAGARGSSSLAPASGTGQRAGSPGTRQGDEQDPATDHRGESGLVRTVGNDGGSGSGRAGGSGGGRGGGSSGGSDDGTASGAVSTSSTSGPNGSGSGDPSGSSGGSAGPSSGSSKDATSGSSDGGTSQGSGGGSSQGSGGGTSQGSGGGTSGSASGISTTSGSSDGTADVSSGSGGSDQATSDGSTAGLSSGSDGGSSDCSASEIH